MNMSCNIAWLREDGQVESIYCDNDGFLEGVGKTLQECFIDASNVKNLIALGDLESLGKTEKHCVAYHRDRNEDWENSCPFVFEDEYEFFEDEDLEWFAYLFKDGQWFYKESGMKISPLQTALEQEGEDE